MTQREILEEIKRLTVTERLNIIETAVQMIRADLQQMESSRIPTERKQQLATAAQALLPDYTSGSELTVFTALDGEDFHA